MIEPNFCTHERYKAFALKFLLACWKLVSTLSATESKRGQLLAYFCLWSRTMPFALNKKIKTIFLHNQTKRPLRHAAVVGFELISVTRTCQAVAKHT